MWYAAHVVMVIRYRQGSQDRFPIYENVFLVQAGSSREAHDIATAIGVEEASHDDLSLRWGDVPARMDFAGVRKVVECLSPPRPDALDLDTGTELTYTEFSVDTEEELAKLVNGDTVTVTIRDFFDDAPPPV